MKELEELEMLHAAATKGEWSVEALVMNGVDFGCTGVETDHEDGVMAFEGSFTQTVCSTLYGIRVDGQQRKNMEFIAAAHNTFPAILAHIRKLEAEVAELRRDREMTTVYRLGPMPNVPNHCTNFVEVHRCEGHRLPVQPFMWKVMWSSNCLSKEGYWAIEPIPSSRDDEFYGEFRFATKDEAFAAAIAAIDAARGAK